MSQLAEQTMRAIVHDKYGSFDVLGVGVSPRHFERAFRQAVGVPHTYVMTERVAAAQHLLLSEPRLTIEKVAARVGFSSYWLIRTA